ncbi:heavy metal translocating P-type ATPase, partial [Priestia aryabhattai]|nr:heavy metal translocating P-type ATPase [Priestia aryabhattai]
MQNTHNHEIHSHDTHSHHTHEHSHEGKEHNGHSHHHGHMVEDFKKRFYISLIVSIPVFFLSPMIHSLLGVDWGFTFDSYLLFALSTFVFFYGGYPFLKGAADEIKQRNLGMMTLIALAIIVAYVYSALTVFILEGMDFFWELVTLIDIM